MAFSTGFNSLVGGSVSTNPDGECAALRADGPATDRSVQHLDLLLLKQVMQASDHGHRIGAEVGINGTACHGSSQTAPARDYVVHFGRTGKRGQNEIAT